MNVADAVGSGAAGRVDYSVTLNTGSLATTFTPGAPPTMSVNPGFSLGMTVDATYTRPGTFAGSGVSFGAAGGGGLVAGAALNTVVDPSGRSMTVTGGTVSFGVGAGFNFRTPKVAGAASLITIQVPTDR